MNDFELLKQWVEDRDRGAGNQLFERYYRQVEGYFMNAVGDQERMDLTQETFLRLTKSAPQFMQRSSFRTYLFGIAHNVLRDHIRKRARRFDPLVDTVEDLDGLTPSRVVSQAARHSRLLGCIRSLPFESQQLLELYYWHAMTADDCAQILDIKPGTVRRRVHDIRGVLQAKLRETQPAELNADLDRQLGDLAKLLFADPT